MRTANGSQVKEKVAASPLVGEPYLLREPNRENAFFDHGLLG